MRPQLKFFSSFPRQFGLPFRAHGSSIPTRSQAREDMDSILLSEPLAVGNPRAAAVAHRSFSYHVPCPLLLPPGRRLVKVPTHRLLGFRRSLALAATGTLMANSVPPRSGVYTVGDFMTGREEMLVVKPSTTVDEALDALVENRITGFPVIDDDWKLVGLVSDYDLLALDSILGGTPNDTSLFPEVDSSWKTFNEVQKLLSKTNGKLVGDLMTPAPVVVRETTNLEDAARILLKTKYRRLPVVDADGKLVGIITRGNVVGAALKIKRASEMKA